MKNAVLLFFLALPCLAMSQQQSIKGFIEDTEQNKVAYANIELPELSLGAVSDDEGNYELTNLPVGTFTLVVSYIGYADIEREVKVEPGSQLMLNFTLESSELSLQTVEITGRTARNYDNDLTYAGTKIATKLKNVPQAISYVTKEVMTDRQAYRVNDVVKNISGINQFSFYNDYTIRGFRSQQELINGLRVIGLFGPQIITANLERVEVIKGPASALFANASPGGTMNRVTKKPLMNERKAISFTTGSFNTQRATLDFTGPLNENKSLLYRLNLAYDNSDDFRDLQEFKSFMVAPSITFLPTDRTRINFDLVLTNFDGKLDRGQPIFGASAGTNLNSTPISFAIGAANDYHKTDVIYSTLSLNHKFSDRFSFNTSYMRYSYSEDLFEHRTSNRFAVDSLGEEIPTLMGMRISARERSATSDNVSNYFAWQTETGALEHNLVFGYDYIQQITPIGGGTIFTSSRDIYRTVDGGLARYNPETPELFIYENGNPKPNIPHFNLENPSYLLGYPSDYILGRIPRAATKYFTHGIYVQDQIKWNKVRLLLGLRQEYYRDIINFERTNESTVKQDKLLPRLGLVYEINDRMNAYASYTESFQPQRTQDLELTKGGPFDPLSGSMIEFGLKNSFFNDRLSANLAVYFIENKNILIEDINTGLLTQRGAEESNGLELDINGRISSNFSITANYAYNDATITESDDEAEIGEAKENAPKHSGGFFLNYTVNEGPIKGMNVNFGSNFVSERNTFDSRLQLPSYQVFDMGASYTINKVKVALTVNNLFDKTHWVGGYSFVRLFPAAPRHFLLNVAYTF